MLIKEFVVLILRACEKTAHIESSKTEEFTVIAINEYTTRCGAAVLVLFASQYSKLLKDSYYKFFLGFN